jgi:hypothetical protein
MMLSAGVAELVDALDLGSSDESCGGSSPSARTKRFQRLPDDFWRIMDPERDFGSPNHWREANRPGAEHFDTLGSLTEPDERGRRRRCRSPKPFPRD